MAGPVPAHADRSPSLSICEGHDGRVLVHCFAGCTADQVVSALGLARRHLFAGPPPSPGRVALLRTIRDDREREHRLRQKARRDAGTT